MKIGLLDPSNRGILKYSSHFYAIALNAIRSGLKILFSSNISPGLLTVSVFVLKNSLGDALMLAGARLTVLDLSDNAFGPDGVKGIERLLKSTACYTLQELRLNNCGMGIGGGKASHECLLRLGLSTL